MSDRLPPLLDLRSLSLEQLKNLFSRARQIKHLDQAHKSFPTPQLQKPFANRGETLALLFFEPSTRTRMSFETAAHRVGLSPLLLDGGIKSSLEKGESIEDSIFNVAAMNPSFLVIRCGDQVDLAQIAKQVRPRILNAGWGVKGHPTQALLDAFTIEERTGKLSGQKVLFVGDVRHSRVAASHFELLPRLQMEVAVCAPDSFHPENYSGEKFQNLDEALDWADIVIALRCQFERHAAGAQPFSVEQYRTQFGLNNSRLRHLKQDGVLMHPGPINHGIELETEVLSDSRCAVLEQVSHGVYIREALLRASGEGAI